MTVRVIDVDLELLSIAWAIASTDIRAMFGAAPNTRVAAGLDPTKNADLPAAAINRITTTEPVSNHLTAPVLDVSVWAATKAAAYDAAALLRGRLHDRDIIGVHAGVGIVTGFETAQGLRPLADPHAPLLARYHFSTRYWAHPIPLA
jgi:hypothetical protein